MRAALAVMCGFLILGSVARAATTHHVRSYRLIDQRGRAFTLADLRGEPTFVTFVASRCADACPLVDGMFDAVQERLRRDHLRAHLLTITLDPSYDSPFVMAMLARRFAADAAFWRVASGERADVEGVLHAFGVTAVRGRDGIDDVHSTFVYVLDARGRRTRTLLASTTLADEAEALLKSPRAGRR